MTIQFLNAAGLTLFLTTVAFSQNALPLDAQITSGVVATTAGTDRFVVPTPNDRLSSISLVLNDSFAQALGLSAEQTDALRKELNQGPLFTMRLTPEQVRVLSPSDITAALAFRQKKMLDLVDEVLTPEQVARLPQLVYQTEIARIGIGKALTEGRLGKDVGVNDNQRDNLSKKAAKIEEKLAAAIKRAHAEAQAEMLAELSTEQRKTAESLLGEPYVFREGFLNMAETLARVKSQANGQKNP